MYGAYGFGPGSEHTPWALNSSDYNVHPHDARIQDKTQWLYAINGRKIFARGGNWLPQDQMFGRGTRFASTRLRAVLGMARDAGYTFLRVDGVGLLEDQSFYRLCDEYGLMIEQEMPLAGCSYGPTNGTWKQADIDAWREQVPVMVAQVKNHPSIVRYSMANEFYRNFTACPVAAAYYEAASREDPSRMARASDPVEVGQRHGPYIFAAVGIGGDEHGSGLLGDYETFEARCDHPLPQVTDLGRCRNKWRQLGGPVDPFEWTEWGASGLSDVETLRTILPEAKLFPTGQQPDWAWHKGKDNPYTDWQQKGVYSQVFLRNGSAFGTIEEEVRASQWLQAEGYRYAYQASRRRKWHRSAMVSWSYNEPWPNVAQQSIIDWRGLPKHAYAWVRDALQMVDVSLQYLDPFAVADGTTRLGGEVMSAQIWIDSEQDAPTPASCVTLEYFYPNGTAAAPKEVHRIKGGAIAPSAAAHVGAVRFKPPASAVGDVLLVRLSLIDGQAAVETRHEHEGAHGDLAAPPIAQHTYAFGLVRPGTSSLGVQAPLAPLLRPPPARLHVSASVAAGGTTVAVRVGTASALAAAHYVKVSVRRSSTGLLQPHDDAQLPFVSASRNQFTLLAGEVVEVSVAMLMLMDDDPHAEQVRVCAEAWNAALVCAGIAHE